MSFLDRLQRELAPEWGLAEGVAERLEGLWDGLQSFGGKLDLEGFKSPAARFHRYFAEPLRSRRWLPKGGTALDIGSGGGSPALPLAIVEPSLRWVLLEPRVRKALFLDQMIHDLDISNAKVTRCRFQEFGVGKASFSLVTTRGVALNRQAWERLDRAPRPGGRLLWFTGTRVWEKSREAIASKQTWELEAQRDLSEGALQGALLVVLKRCSSP